MTKIILARFAPIPAAVREAQEALARQAAAQAAHEAQIRQAVAQSKAVDVFEATHPAHDEFIVWLNGRLPTKRKAREFCRAVA